MRCFKICLFIVITSIFYAKADKIIINGDTIYFWPNRSALEQHPDIENIRKFLAGYKTDSCFDCRMVDYIAEWTMTDNTLYLTGIYPDNSIKPGEKADLNKVFHVSNARVKAAWVNGSFWIPVGKPLRYRDMLTPVYGAERLLVIKNGHVIIQQVFKYPTDHRLQDLEVSAFL